MIGRIMAWLRKRPRREEEAEKRLDEREKSAEALAVSQEARLDIQRITRKLARESAEEVTRQRQIQRSIIGTGNWLEDDLFGPAVQDEGRRQL